MPRARNFVKSRLQNLGKTYQPKYLAAKSRREAAAGSGDGSTGDTEDYVSISAPIIPLITYNIAGYEPGCLYAGDPWEAVELWGRKSTSDFVYKLQ